MMSKVRIKLFSFDSTKSETKDIEKVVNEFLERDDIIVDPADVIITPSDFTVVNIVYKLKNKS